MSKAPRKVKGNHPGRPETRVLKILLPIRVVRPVPVYLQAASHETEEEILKSGDPFKGRNQGSDRRDDTHRCGLL